MFLIDMGDWAQAVITMAITIIGIYVLIAASPKRMYLMFAGIGLALLGIGNFIGSFEGPITASLSLLESSLILIGVVLVTSSLLMMAIKKQS